MKSCGMVHPVLSYLIETCLYSPFTVYNEMSQTAFVATVESIEFYGALTFLDLESHYLSPDEKVGGKSLTPVVRIVTIKLIHRTRKVGYNTSPHLHMYLFNSVYYVSIQYLSFLISFFQ